MARWITVTKVPFDYRWPGRTAITAFTDRGEFFVKDEVAEFAIAKGYATEGKADGSEARATPAPKRGRKPRNATPPADARPAHRVDRAHLVATDRAGGEPPVDDAG